MTTMKRRSATAGKIRVSTNAILVAIAVISSLLLTLSLRMARHLRPSCMDKDEGLGLITARQQYGNMRANQTRVVVDQQLTRQSSSDRQQQPSSAADDNDIMSSCMLIMDDNHWLVEWLAYHWTVLNLRFMIIAIDERSKTSPLSILDKWKGKIEFELWNDSHFFTLGDKEGMNLQEINLARQHAFLPKCMQVLKQRNYSWTLFTDTDEFVVINPRTSQEGHALFRPSVPALDQPGSIMTFLKQEQEREDPHTICFSMGRLQFSPDEAKLEQVERDIPSYLNASHFMTLRWLYAADDLVGPKNIVDLSRVPARLIPQGETHQHRVIHDLCPEAGHTWTRKNSLLEIYHFLGTLEQHSFRADARLALKTAGRNKRFDRYRGKHIGWNDDLRLWLKAFVSTVGQQEALRLLEGVGRTTGWEDSNLHAKRFAGPLDPITIYNDIKLEQDDDEGEDATEEEEAAAADGSDDVDDASERPAFFTEARLDRAGASLGDMLLAHAYAFANNIIYGGACSPDDLPHQNSTQRLIDTVGLSDLLRFACPRRDRDSMIARSVYANQGTSLFTPSYLNFLHGRVQYPATTTAKYNVAVHIRRGDVSPCSEYANRYLPNSHYLDILKEYVPSNLSVAVFSESNSVESWDDFRNCTLFLDTDLGEAWKAMMTADYVVVSKSSFSLIPAVLNRNATVIYTPFMHKKLKGWTEVSSTIQKKTSNRVLEIIQERCTKEEKKIALRKLKK
jgi:hypothetical protein